MTPFEKKAGSEPTFSLQLLAKGLRNGELPGTRRTLQPKDRTRIVPRGRLGRVIILILFSPVLVFRGFNATGPIPKNIEHLCTSLRMTLWLQKSIF
jgi:hypothetical protein